MKTWLKKHLPHGLVNNVRETKATLNGVYKTTSYSQEGEDLILSRLFEGKSTGFYVDVGAHHPRRFSNTYLFYKRGWRGINIEPNPDVSALFKRYRKRDINVTLGIANTTDELVYFMFNDPALNTFDQALSEGRQSDQYYVVSRQTIPVRPLAVVLQKYLPAGAQIDFMSIDVEGYDLEVLESNDWSRFRPNCILVEDENFSIANIYEEPVNQLMTRQRYSLFAKSFNTLFYTNNDNQKEISTKGAVDVI